MAKGGNKRGVCIAAQPCPAGYEQRAAEFARRFELALTRGYWFEVENIVREARELRQDMASGRDKITPADPVARLGLTGVITNTLEKYGFRHISDVMDTRNAVLEDLPNLGPRSVAVLRQRIRDVVR